MESCTPAGVFAFISKLWSGRASDKLLVRGGGILDLLEPADNFMADKGFDIEELLAERKASRSH